MEASGWGKPLKKAKEPAKDAPSTTDDPLPGENPLPKISTKSEPFVQKAVLDPIQIVARAREGLYLADDQVNNYLKDAGRIICDEANISLFSSDGDVLAFANPERVGVYVFSQQNGHAYDLPNILAMRFSPGVNFLVTIDKRDTKYFICIFEPKHLKLIHQYETVKYKKETWPQLKFIDKDELAFRSLVPGKIEVLNPLKNFELVRVIETKPFDFFNVSLKREDLIVVCVNLEHSAGYEKNEGKIDVYEYDNPSPTPTVSRIIDKAHEVGLFFSPDGKNLLAWAQIFFDKTGQSYYGEHVLLYLDMAKKVLRRVPTYKGPIHDVAWNSTGSEFIVISGFMPANSVLFTNKNIPKFEFGNHHKNTIKWSPNSKFVCLAGFGNLSGEMELWDMTSIQKIGACKANAAVSCWWSPDNRRILTGVLNPRLRVDNGYKVFKYNGEQLNSVDFSSTELYEVLWRPGNYEDQPITPMKKADKKDEEPAKAFRPKGSAFAAQLKAQKDTKSAGRYLDPDEMFGNEANLEVEEKKEEPKKKKRIRKKKDRKGGEETKDDEEGEDEN